MVIKVFITDSWKTLRQNMKMMKITLNFHSKSIVIKIVMITTYFGNMWTP